MIQNRYTNEALEAAIGKMKEMVEDGWSLTFAKGKVGRAMGISVRDHDLFYKFDSYQELKTKYNKYVHYKRRYDRG